MNSKTILLVAITLIAAMIVPKSVSALTEDPPVDPVVVDEYQYVDTISTTLSISGGTAEAKVCIRDYNGDVTKLSGTMQLQKYSDGSWRKVSGWSKTVNTSSLTMSHTKSVSKGKYRVKCVVKAYKGANSETITDYSKTKSY